MAIAILPATVDDVPEMVPVGLLGFQNDLLNRAILPLHQATPEQLEEHLTWRMVRQRDRMTGEGRYFVKAVDEETGAIVGMCGIFSPEVVRQNSKGGTEASGAEVVSVPDGEAKQKPEASQKPKKLEIPSILKTELQERLEGVMKKAQGEILGGREDVWKIPTMVVHPDYQRRGIAKKLLLAACAHADKVGQDVYLEASPAGRKLYASNGFEECGVDDLGKIVGAEYFPLTYMLRKFRPEYAVAGAETNGHAG